MNRPCLDCGTPSPGSRCPDCTPPAPPRDRQHVHFNTARWKRLSARLRRLSPFCELCGSVHDLTVDHIVRIADRPEWTYEVANLRVLCRRCNGRISLIPATTEQVAQVEARITARKTRGVGVAKSVVPSADKARSRSHTPGGIQ